MHKVLSKMLTMFLKLPGSRVLFMAIGERVTRGGRYGLEIPLRAKLNAKTKEERKKGCLGGGESSDIAGSSQ